MAKKKARHLYEILGKGAAHPPPASGQQASSAESALREKESAKLPETFLPEEIPSGKALENVITIRRDTAVLGIVLIIVLWVIAFLLGRWTAPKTAPSAKPAPGESAASVGSQAEPAPISLQSAGTAESVGGASSAREKYYLMIAAYDEGQKKYADEAAEFLIKKGYPVVVEKSGDKFTIKLRNFQSRSDANALRIQSEITTLEYKGRKDFRTAHFVEVR